MPFAKGIGSWRQELLAYFDEPTTTDTPRASSTDVWTSLEFLSWFALAGRRVLQCRGLSCRAAADAVHDARGTVYVTLAAARTCSQTGLAPVQLSRTFTGDRALARRRAGCADGESQGSATYEMLFRGLLMNGPNG